MTKEEIFEKLRTRIADEMCVSEKDINKITLETDIVTDLGADELDSVECVMAIEEIFGICIPENDCETYGMNSSEFKMSKAVDYIYNRLNDRQTPPQVSPEN